MRWISNLYLYLYLYKFVWEEWTRVRWISNFKTIPPETWLQRPLPLYLAANDNENNVAVNIPRFSLSWSCFWKNNEHNVPRFSFSSSCFWKTSQKNLKGLSPLNSTCSSPWQREKTRRKRKEKVFAKKMVGWLSFCLACLFMVCWRKRY